MELIKILGTTIVLISLRIIKRTRPLIIIVITINIFIRTD